MRRNKRRMPASSSTNSKRIIFASRRARRRPSQRACRERSLGRRGDRGSTGAATVGALTAVRRAMTARVESLGARGHRVYPGMPMPLVLLVDDDPAVRSALARFVGRLGHEVAQACDGAEGVSAIHRINPDLVITDMEMPGGTGFVVLEAGMKARVPVVILTAHASVEMAV